MQKSGWAKKNEWTVLSPQYCIRFIETVVPPLNVANVWNNVIFGWLLRIWLEVLLLYVNVMYIYFNLLLPVFTVVFYLRNDIDMGLEKE